MVSSRNTKSLVNTKQSLFEIILRVYSTDTGYYILKGYFEFVYQERSSLLQRVTVAGGGLISLEGLILVTAGMMIAVQKVVEWWTWSFHR